MGWISALIALPVFYYRHYVIDKGKFPKHMFDDLIPEGKTRARSEALRAAAVHRRRRRPGVHDPRLRHLLGLKGVTSIERAAASL